MAAWNCGRRSTSRSAASGFPINITGIQTTGWFREPIEDIGQPNGPRVRIPGLADRVNSAPGVTVAMPPQPVVVHLRDVTMDRLSTLAAAALCIVLMFLVAGDVLGRYLLRVGAVWLQELHRHLISPIALFGMSCALLCGEAVRVNVFLERYSLRLPRAIEVLGGLLPFAIGPWPPSAPCPRRRSRGDATRPVPNPAGCPRAGC